VATPNVPARRAIAVLGIRNNSAQSDAAWLSTALSEMLTSELGVGGAIRVIAGQDVARVKTDLGLGEPESLSADVLQRVRRSLDASSFVVGSYTLVGERGSRLLRIDLRVVDAATGQVVASSG